MNSTISERYSDLILIPTDFSKACENALIHGLELAKLLHFKVCLLHIVVNEKRGIFNKNIGAFTILKELNAIKARYATEYPVEIEVLVMNGKLLEVIEQVATENKASFIILGTHKKRGSQHYFGNLVLKNKIDAPCPVINVQLM